MKSTILILAVILTSAMAQARDCRNKAKHEGIADLEDSLQITCAQNSATVTPIRQGETDITRYEVVVSCGGKNRLSAIYLKSDCFDASAKEIQFLIYGN